MPHASEQPKRVPVQRSGYPPGTVLRSPARVGCRAAVQFLAGYVTVACRDEAVSAV